MSKTRGQTSRLWMNTPHLIQHIFFWWWWLEKINSTAGEVCFQAPEFKKIGGTENSYWKSTDLTVKIGCGSPDERDGWCFLMGVWGKTGFDLTLMGLNWCSSTQIGILDKFHVKFDYFGQNTVITITPLDGQLLLLGIPLNQGRVVKKLPNQNWRFLVLLQRENREEWLKKGQILVNRVLGGRSISLDRICNLKWANGRTKCVGPSENSDGLNTSYWWLSCGAYSLM